MTDFGEYGSSLLKFNGAVLLQDQSAVFKQMRDRLWEDRHAMPAQQAFSATSKWAAGYNSVFGNGPPYPEDLYWSTLNQEIQAFPTGDAIRGIDCDPATDPFSSWNADGSLNITPRPLTNEERATMTGTQWADSVWARLKLNSGAFCSYPFGLTPPYCVELRCRMPKAKGTWPAFWLINTNGQWPPELDVFEGVSGQLTTSIHSANDTSWQQAARNDNTTWVSGPNEGYPRATQNLSGDIGEWHTYSVAVYQDKIGIFVDRVLVKQWQTPKDFTAPMHVMANYAVGGPGDWPGTPPDPLGPYEPFVISNLAVWRFPASYGQGAVPPDPIVPPEPIPPDPGPEPIPPDPTPTPTVVAISVTGPDTLQVSLTINGQPT